MGYSILLNAVRKMPNITYVIIACNIDKGMKSFGSKGLMTFNNKKLLDHQISWIKKKKNKNTDIIIVTNFDYFKLKKAFGQTVRVIEAQSQNPIYVGCVASKNADICFIDYGCLFDPILIQKVDSFTGSTIITTDKSKDLGVGCIVAKEQIEHMFLDLPENKFCNVFFLSQNDTTKIKQESFYQRHNLLYFETINRLIETGSCVSRSRINNKNFIYFNNMRQKNAISRFIKKYSN